MTRRLITVSLDLDPELPEDRAFLMQLIDTGGGPAIPASQEAAGGSPPPTYNFSFDAGESTPREGGGGHAPHRNGGPNAWPSGCPVHHQPFESGRYGPYCKRQAGPGEPHNEKGYCNLKPGVVWSGRLVTA